MDHRSNYDFYAFRYTGPSKASKEGHVSYGKKCKKGDVIICRLEFLAGTATLYFQVNDEDFGPAFEDLKGPLYPFANLLHCNDKITILG